MDPSAPAFVPAADASSNPRGGSRRRDRRGGKRAEGAGQPSTAQAPEAANVSGEPAGSNSHDGPDLRQEKTTRRGRGGKRGAPRQPVSPNPETQNAPENPEPKPLRRPNGPLRGQNGQSGSRRGRSGPRPENGPGRTPSSTSTSSPVAPFPDAPETDDLMTKLIRKLTQGTYECYICYANVLPHHQTWSCDNCYAVFHLGCISQWAQKSMPVTPGPSSSGGAASGFRCPGCNHTHHDFPSSYKCFCGKTTNPTLERGVTPHCCERLCLLKRPDGCPHDCLASCHPGPHPPCSRTIEVPCFCGKTGFTLRCGTGAKQVSCGAVCGKRLGCGNHFCDDMCHEGPCAPCEISTTVHCYCGKRSRTIACGESTTDVEANGYSCGEPCGFDFHCAGRHNCERICHPDPHAPGEKCPFDPSVIATCPCGKTHVEAAARTSCTEEILTCGKTCGKSLRCGGVDHTCKARCHVGECPKCTERLTVPCRCGLNTLTVVCGDSERRDGKLVPPTCEKICQTLRSCRKHQCGKRCCPVGSRRTPEDPDGLHICTLVCGKMLKCGLHSCGELCHKGPCPPCLNASFEELSCHCGRTVLFPPIPCGAKPPACRHPCIRRRACGHPMAPHECHGDDVTCPPCVVLVERPCTCGRKIFKVPCSKSSTAVSCGDPCLIEMECGHSCSLVCHMHDRRAELGTCIAKCTVQRPVCLHPHNVTCHFGTGCDWTVPCGFAVKVTCKCGNRSQMGVCGQVSKVVEKDEGGFFSGIGVKHSVDEPATVSTKAWRNFLPCDGSCEVAERNKRLAEALEIDTARNGPAIGSSAAGDEAVPIEYPDSMLSFAKANSAFVKALEKDFADFLLDRTRKSTRMLTSAKRIYLAFAQRLASQFYEFDAIIEDPDSKAPGLFLKKKTATKIPGILASEAATQPPKPRVPKPSAPTAGMACNAFHLLGIAWGMDSRSISILLEPLFGTSVGSPVINWQGEDDLLVTVRPLGTSDPAVIETFLKGVKGQVSDKFVGNGWAKEVRLCWVDRNLKVREEEGQKIKDEPSSSQVVQGPGPAVLDTRNQFEVLDSEREEAEKDGALKPKVADSWGDQPADQETVDTWETLAE